MSTWTSSRFCNTLSWLVGPTTLNTFLVSSYVIYLTTYCLINLLSRFRQLLLLGYTLVILCITYDQLSLRGTKNPLKLPRSQKCSLPLSAIGGNSTVKLVLSKHHFFFFTGFPFVKFTLLGSICLSFSFIYLFIHLFIYLCIYLFIYLFISRHQFVLIQTFSFACSHDTVDLRVVSFLPC